MNGVLAPVLAALAALLAVGGSRRLLARPAARPRDGRRGAAARLVRRAPGLRALGARIERAGLPVGPPAFLLLAGGAALLAAALAGLALRRPEPALAAAAGVVLAVRALLRSADRRHVARVAAQLPGVADHLAGALAAGLSLRQALVRVARDAPDPAGTELRRAAAELALGARVEEALDALASRLPDPDLRLMVTAILVQRRAGGDLARALAELAGRLEERARLARELRGATAQARATAWLVAALPLAGAVLVELASPGTLGRTLGRGPGLAVLAVSVAMQAAGMWWIRRIARVQP